ncbi:DUF416 family protein [Halomonadaceae bacterium KBTZ08]
MNSKQWQREMNRLTGWRQFGFILALAERAFPNYALFAEITEPEWGDRFRDALDWGWRMLAIKDHDVDPLKQLTRLEGVYPDPAQYDFYGVAPAMDAWHLLEQAFLCHVNPEKKRAFDAAARALESVTTFIEVSEGEGLDDDALVKLFDGHELVKAEKVFQKTLAETLRRAQAPDGDTLNELHGMAHNEGVSSLGLAVPERWATTHQS